MAVSSKKETNIAQDEKDPGLYLSHAEGLVRKIATSSHTNYPRIASPFQYARYVIGEENKSDTKST